MMGNIKKTEMNKRKYRFYEEDKVYSATENRKKELVKCTHHHRKLIL